MTKPSVVSSENHQVSSENDAGNDVIKRLYSDQVKRISQCEANVEEYVEENVYVTVVGSRPMRGTAWSNDKGVYKRFRTEGGVVYLPGGKCRIIT